MAALNKIRRKTAHPRNGASRPRRDVPTVFEELALYLEEEKRKFRREVSEQIHQWLLPLLNEVDRKVIGKSTLASLFERKLEEITALPPSALRRTLSQLSPAEWQVCQRLRQGQRTKQIAEELNLSPSTVENQRNAIRRKLGLSHSINLVTFLQQL